jgi:hypothetical protein
MWSSRASLVLGAASFAALAPAACGTILGFEQGALRSDGGAEAAADGPTAQMDARGDGAGSDAGTVTDAGLEAADGGPPADAPVQADVLTACDATLCGSTCVPDCTMCGQLSVTCYACDGGGAPVAICGSMSSSAFCLNGNYAHCMCGQPSDCPGDNQVCTGNDCTSCGEMGTDMQSCAHGGRCNQQLAQCF